MWGSIGAVTKEVQDRLGTSFICKIQPDAEDPDYYQTVMVRDGTTKRIYSGFVLNRELIDPVMQLDGVVAYNGQLVEYVSVDNIQLYPGAAANRYQCYTSDPERMADKAADVEWGGLVDDELSLSNTAIYGNTETSLNDKFRSGAFELVSGRHVTAGDNQKVLISDELAAKNGLELGATVAISIRNRHLGWWDLRKYDPTRLTEIVEQVKNLNLQDSQYLRIFLDDTMYQSTVDPLNSIRNLVAGLMAVIVAALALAIALPVSVPVTDIIGNRMFTSTIEAAQPQEKEYTDEEIYNATMSGKLSELFAYDSDSYGGPEQIDFPLVCSACWS